MGCGRRWILFGSDFRTQTDFSSCPSFKGCGPTMDIFWIRFLDPNFFLSVHHLWVVADDGYFLGSIFGPKLIFLSVHHLWVVARRWIFFESDFRTQTDFSFSPPFMGCGRRWIFFGSDFRTQTDFSSSPSFMGCGPTMDIFLIRFLDPNFFLSVHHLWVVADDGYFLGSIFGPKLIFLSVHHLWIVARRWIFFESDFWTPIYSFCCRASAGAQHPYSWAIWDFLVRWFHGSMVQSASA